jgi:tetratricopeptide (TPR) repeat protein
VTGRGWGGSMTRAEAQRLLGLARQADLVGPDAAGWVARLAPERTRLLEAARFLVEHGEEEAVVELAAGTWRLWLLSGEVADGREVLAAALNVGAGWPSRARALALYGDGLLAFRQGAQAESQARNQAALQVARAVGDREAEALALVGLSRVAFRDGDYPRVQSLAAQARELTGELDAAAGVAPLHMLAAGTRLAGDLDRAALLYTESLELNRRLGDRRMVGVELHNLGHLELHRGNLEAAERCFSEVAGLRDPHDPYMAGMAQLNQAALAVARGGQQRAAELLGRAQATLEGAGIVLDPDDAFEVDWLREQLGSPGDT